MSRLATWCVRAAGGEPDVVLPLLQALRRDAVGVNELLRSRDSRGFRIPPSAMHIVGLVLAALGSVGLVIAFVMGAQRGQPLLGPIVLCVAQVVFLASNLVGQVVPALLCAEDERAVGWWPLSRRDLVLARLGTVLVPGLQLTAALAGAPLVTLMVVGRPTVVAGLLLALAVLLQTLVLAVGAAALATALVRGVGTRRARKLAAPLVDGNLSVLPLLLMWSAQPLMRFFEQHPQAGSWLPPVWFACWGDPLAGARAWRGMALSAALSVLVLVVGWRAATPRAAAPEREGPAPAGRRRAHWTDVMPLLLRPWLRGREGWVTGRLLAAHLRDDWRFGANALLNLTLLGGMLWYHTRPEGDGADPAFDLLLGGTQVLLMMTISIPFLVAFSSTPKALWVVAMADLDARRLLAAQRGLVRGLALVPLMAIMLVRGLQLGAGGPPLAVALALMALECEFLLLLTQRVQPLLAFSRAYTRDQNSQSVVRGMVLLGLLVAVAALNFGASAWAPLRYGLLGALPLAIFGARRLLDRHVKGSRLNAAEIAG